MFTAEQCHRCMPTFTCGFSCYYYWHRRRPAPNRIPRDIISKYSSDKISLNNLHPQPNHAKSSLKRSRETINIDTDDDDDDKEEEPEKKRETAVVKSRHEHSVVPGNISTFDQAKNASSNQLIAENFLPTNPHSHTLEKKTFPITSTDFQHHISSSPQSCSSTNFKPTPTKKHTPNSLSCIDRKRIIVFNRPEAVSTAMQNWYTTTLSLLDPFRSDEDCWFHPSPPLCKSSRATKRPTSTPSVSTPTTSPPRTKTTITKTIYWTSPTTGRHSVTLNFGIVSKLLTRTMSRQQKDGFITRAWHLSHLCGNWTCVNPNHATVEDGRINLERNSCFMHRSGCGHVPPCLKEKKVPLMRGAGRVEEEVGVGWGGDGEGHEDWWGRWGDDDDDYDYNNGGEEWEGDSVAENAVVSTGGSDSGVEESGEAVGGEAGVSDTSFTELC